MLVLVAASLIVLMGMAAFTIDYGWLYLNQLNTRKAAEAAALAGVVHMPQPNCALPVAGTEPHTTALDLAARNGYSAATGATVTPAQGDTCARLRVTISNTIPTFFMKVFGIDELNVVQEATAEQLPPLKLGSDEPYLGTDPTVSGRDRNFFVAISGEDRRKGQGDAVAAERRQGGGSNPEYSVPSYYYAFEIPEGSSLIGGTVYVQVFDPQAYDQGGLANTGPNGVTNDWVYNRYDATINTDGWNSKTRFRVFAPDATPNQWTDNNVQVSGCNRTYRGASDSFGQAHANFDPSLVDTWVNVCTIGSAARGIYVIEVSSDYESNDGTDMINGFSIRGSSSGAEDSSGAVTSTSDLQVYGLGTMSLWQFDTGSNPVFKIARLDEVYAGSSLIISLWDVSDIGSSASIEFVGGTSGADPIDCRVRRVSDAVDVLGGAATGAWGPDSNGGAGTTCRLSFTSGQYNNEWIQFRFDIPPSYTCPGGSGASPASPGCWVFVSYGVAGSITDRTTWAAAIDGQPIHLIP